MRATPTGEDSASIHPALPLYTTADAERVHSRGCTRSTTATWIELGPDVRGRFLNIGHILGSAMVEVRYGDRTLVFSGDVGRYGVPLHSDPDPLPACDALVVESTYGDRTHGDDDDGGADPRAASCVPSTVAAPSSFHRSQSDDHSWSRFTSAA